MKTIISQRVTYENDRFPYEWTKEVESNLIPAIGMSIEDTLWKDPYTYKITDIIIDYSENCYYVTVEPFEIVITSNIKEDMEKAAQLHGWKLPWIDLK